MDRLIRLSKALLGENGEGIAIGFGKVFLKNDRWSAVHNNGQIVGSTYANQHEAELVLIESYKQIVESKTNGTQ